MNIIYMHTHDSGKHFQPYGHAVSTPNLMKLAEEGVMFHNAYCGSPSCSASRSALLTGLAPHTNGMMGLCHRGFRLNDYSKHLANVLKEHGFETTLCGFQHEAPQHDVPSIGYQRTLHRDDQRGTGGESFTKWDLDNARSAAEYILTADKHFFLSIGMLNTHRPFPPASGEIKEEYLKPPDIIANNAVSRGDMAQLVTAVHTVDKCAGIVLDALRESGKEEETLVIFTTDHGLAFPKMKGHLYDAGIGVALIMKLGNKIPQGCVTDSLVSHLDIFPTICELIGLEQPAWLQGVSLCPLFDQLDLQVREEIFSELTFHTAYDPMRCIRTERYKLIKYMEENHRFIVHLGGDGGSSDEFVTQYGMLAESRAQTMLFDLYLDPAERINVVDDPRYFEVYENLTIRLERWMKETGDPLIHGKLDIPDGLRLSSPHQNNPHIPINSNLGR